MNEEKRRALNEMCDRIEAIPPSDRLEWVKAMVAETLKFPGTDEATKTAILAEMENGGYEALLRELTATKIPAGFDPKNRPWNRN